MANILYLCKNRKPIILGYVAACSQFVFWASMAEWSLKMDNDNEKYIYTGLCSVTSLAIPAMIQFYLSRRVKSISLIKDTQQISIQSQAIGIRPELYPLAMLRTREALQSQNPTNFDLILSAERHGLKPKAYLIDRNGSFADKKMWDYTFFKV